MNDVSGSNPGGKNNFLAIFIGIIVVAALLFGGYYYYTSRGGDLFGSFSGGSGEEEQSEVVARVDGVDISRAEYDRNLEQLVNMYTVQGTDTTDENTASQIREQVLNTLINRQLVLAAAQKSDINITEADIDAEYQNVLENVGGEEALATAMADTGLSNADLRLDLKNGLLIQRYLETRVGINTIEVTDAEVQQYYDAAKAQGAEVPDFEDVSTLIKEQLLAEKQQQVINTALEGLRTEANIEVLI